MKRLTKIGIVSVFTSLFFLLEIVTGYLSGSIALIADSFHMLSDLLALVIAAYAIQLAAIRKNTPNFSFGFQRAEVLGAFANSVFLLALCFTIVIEAIQRFFDPVEIKDPRLVLIVGSVGLVFNIVGMFLFHEHGHHSHDSGHSHSLANDSSLPSTSDSATATVVQGQDQVLEDFDTPDSPTIHYSAHTRANIIAAADKILEDSDNVHNHNHQSHSHNHKNLNMHGLFLHVLGDALGSLGVIISALVVMYADGDWRNYMDPVVSILISFIIIYSTVPLIKSASLVLLQGVPSTISMDKLRNEIRLIPGILDVHEFHVWGLSDLKSVASVHIRVYEESTPNYMEIAATVKKLLHSYGVHSTTVQPEFTSLTRVANSVDFEENGCLLKCEEVCNESVCCPQDVVTHLNDSNLPQVGLAGIIFKGKKTKLGDLECNSGESDSQGHGSHSHEHNNHSH